MKKLLLISSMCSLIATQEATRKPLLTQNFPAHDGMFLAKKKDNILYNMNQLLPDDRAAWIVSQSSFLHDVVLETAFQSARDFCFWWLWDFLGEYIFSGKKIEPALEEYLKKEIAACHIDHAEDIHLRTIRPCAKRLLRIVQAIYGLLTGVDHSAFNVLSYRKTIFIDPASFAAYDQLKSAEHINKQIAALVAAEAYALTHKEKLIAKIIGIDTAVTFIKNLAAWSFIQKSPIATFTMDGTAERTSVLRSKKLNTLNLARIAHFLGTRLLYRTHINEMDAFVASTTHGEMFRNILQEIDEEEYRIFKYIPELFWYDPHYASRIEHIDARINEIEKENQQYKEQQ